MASLIRLDTHVVAWLHAGLVDRFSDTARELIEASELAVSPMVELELTYLFEIGRLRVTGAEVVADLSERIGLRRSEVSTGALVSVASTLSWTRDPFDRLIAADALAAACPLLTKDEQIRRHVEVARW